jgi:hypothetical protein
LSCFSITCPVLRNLRFKSKLRFATCHCEHQTFRDAANEMESIEVSSKFFATRGWQKDVRSSPSPPRSTLYLSPRNSALQHVMSIFHWFYWLGTEVWKSCKNHCRHVFFMKVPRVRCMDKLTGLATDK